MSEILAWSLLVFLVVYNFRYIGIIVIRLVLLLVYPVFLVGAILQKLFGGQEEGEAETDYHCGWLMKDENMIGIHVSLGNRVAVIDSDGEHFVPQSLSRWRLNPQESVSEHYSWTRGDELTPDEKMAVIGKALEFMAEQRILPRVVLLEEESELDIWRESLSSYRDHVHDIVVWPELKLRKEEYRNWQDHKPFGRILMERVAQTLQTGTDLCNSHRDYCGHGLFYRDGMFILATVDSGEPFETLGEWNDKESFVEFFQKQSDYSCSGADDKSLIFAAKSTWDLGNQRLTRKRMESL